MKKMISFGLALMLVFALASCKSKSDGELYWSVTMFADEVTDKFSSDDKFYLTIDLDDSMIDTYHLDDEELTIVTGKELYDKIAGNEKLLGVTLQVTVPADKKPAEQKDSSDIVRWILQEKNVEYCKIESITTKDNTKIS